MQLRLKRAVALIAVSGLAGFFPACASSEGAIEVDQFKDDLNASAPLEYLIHVGDVLNVQVYSDEKASSRPRVRSDGRITLPFLNDIDAAGKTPVALAADIEAGLKRILVNPSVMVSVDQSSPLTISRVKMPSISVTTSRPVDCTKKRWSPSAPSATSRSILT